MRIEGAIYPTKAWGNFSRDTWCQFVAGRPEFRRPPPRQIRNPFTGEAATVHPTPDVAEVVVAGRVLGQVYWSMSDEPLINISVEPPALSLVREWTAALGGEFRPNRETPEGAPALDRNQG